MKIIVLILMLFVAGSLFGQEEFDYGFNDDLKLLLVKKDTLGIFIICQSILDEPWIEIYKFDGTNSLNHYTSINLAQEFEISPISVIIKSADFINGNLYLNAEYSIIVGTHQRITYNKIFFSDFNTRDVLDYSSESETINDIKMINNNQGLFLMNDRILYTNNKWKSYHKVLLDQKTKLNKITYIKNLNNIVICERDSNLNLIEFVVLDLFNPSNVTKYTHPIDNENYETHYKPYSLLISEENEFFYSYEYASTPSNVNFEIVKSNDNGQNWDYLYKSKLSNLYSNGYNKEYLMKFSKIEIEGNRILAVNFEKILYSNNKGKTWIEFEHDFAKGDDYKRRKNIFPMFVDGEPIIFTETSIITLDITSNSVIEETLKIYPNPVKDKVRVSFEALGNENLNNIKLELVNISSGESYSNTNYNVINKDEKVIEIELNVKNYMTGAYLLKLSNGNISKVEKLIIE